MSGWTCRSRKPSCDRLRQYCEDVWFRINSRIVRWMLDVEDIAYIESGSWIAFYRKLVETNLKLLISIYLLVWIDV